MFPKFPEPLLLEHPSGESFTLDVRNFVSIPDLMQFIAVIYADWGYYCGQLDTKRGEKSYLGKWLLYQPEAEVGHRQSRSTVFWFWVQLDYEGATLHEFSVGALDDYLTARYEHCLEAMYQWYEEMCAAIDRLIFYALEGATEPTPGRPVRLVDAIKVCERCRREDGRPYGPQITIPFEDCWICHECRKEVEREREEERRRQMHLSALTEKYGDAEEAVRRLAMEEERKKLTSSLRFKILERDQFTCQLCGRKAPEVKLTVDHKFPVAEGGKTEEDNLWTLCRECNAGKRDRIIELPEWV